ncbi:tRNA(His) guanylyltransferase 1 [Capsicum annuum]|uniref:tRNA(His) guanylyltransferase 1 n=1 Tax=Capsicum annuum TaxID=4072 RepID=A0A2G2Z165_CAPAN|nr:tRNA(His) guanylyltransferase 1 [Capsicum annuum]
MNEMLFKLHFPLAIQDDDAKVKTAFNTLPTYAKNVATNPNEKKFRKIRLLVMLLFRSQDCTIKVWETTQRKLIRELKFLRMFDLRMLGIYLNGGILLLTFWAFVGNLCLYSNFLQYQLSSVSVSFMYVMKWKEFFPENDFKEPPYFDGRSVCYPSSEILRHYLAWGQVDCHINNQYHTCFWMLVKSAKSITEAQSYRKVDVMVEPTVEQHNITIDNPSSASKEEEKVELVSPGEWKNYLFEGFNILDEASKNLTKLFNDYSEWIADGLLKHHGGRYINHF